MDEGSNDPTKARPKHLLSPEDVARSSEGNQDPDLTRAHGQGNGMRVHLLTFGLASLAVIVVLVAVFVLVGRMM